MGFLAQEEYTSSSITIFFFYADLYVCITNSEMIFRITSFLQRMSVNLTTNDSHPFSTFCFCCFVCILFFVITYPAWFISIRHFKTDTFLWPQLHTFCKSHSRLKFRKKDFCSLGVKGLTRESIMFCFLFGSDEWCSLFTWKAHVRFQRSCKYIAHFLLNEIPSISWMPQLRWWYIFLNSFFFLIWMPRYLYINTILNHLIS